MAQDHSGNKPKKPKPTTSDLPYSLSDARGIGGNASRLSHYRSGQKTPDWKEEWSHKPKVSLWQACALSLDIEPYTLEHSDTAWMGGPDGGPVFTARSFPSDAVKQSFERRLRVLIANITDNRYFSPYIATTRDVAYDEVRLDEFAAWAMNVVKWDGLPPELVAMAQKPESRASALAEQSDAKAGDPRANEGEKIWIDKARGLALEYIDRHKTQDLFPTQNDVCRHVEGEMRKQKIYGPQGKPITQGYIARNAIQGEWWKTNKP